MKHIISVSQFDKNYINKIFSFATHVKNFGFGFDFFNQKIVTCLFYQPSTRTYSSFLAAAQRLKAAIIPIQGVEYSSVSKGESFEDTIKTLSMYSDCIVLRHPEVGSASKAAEISDKPIINAGDGIGEHPTQALLDLYTIFEERKSINGLHVAFMGDNLHSRTVHSLFQLLSLYDVKISFVGPEELSDKESLSKYPNVKHYEDIQEIIHEIDVLYVTRVQKEYLSSDLRDKKFSYQVTPELMSLAKPDMILMHPFPRINEIPTSIDTDPRAAYFKQIKNGLYVRGAVLYELLK